MSQTVKYPSYRHEKIELFLVGIAILFVLVNALTLSLTQEGSVISQVIYPAIIWTLAIGAVYLFLERRLPQRDRLIYPIAAFTTGWGVLLVQRLAPAFVWRQLLWAVLGSVSLAVVSVMFPERTGDPGGLRFLRRFRHTWLILGLVLLATTFIFGVNPSGEGLRLWLGGNVPFLGKVYVQPSEILKILTVVFLASYMAERHELVPNRHFKIGRFRIALLPTSYVAPLLFSWGISVVLLILQRDLGAAMLFILTFLAMLYLAGGSWEAVVIGFTMMIATIAIAYLIPVPQLDVVRLRLDTWINPWIDSSGRGFQIVQSLIAVSSGGIIGEGIGAGYPTFIPVVHSDFVFSAIAEEWGLIGGVCVVFCFAVLLHRGMSIAMVRRHPFLRFLAAGTVLSISLQVFVIVGGVLKLLPLTGVTLPLMSYGGSSMLVSCTMIGLLLKISAAEQYT